MSVQYTSGCSVHWGISLSTLGDITEYTGGCSVHWGIMSTLESVQYSGDTMMSVGDIMSTAGVFSTLGDNMMSVGDIMN